jgi:nucleoside 2-deoxyribosyltransferase
MSPICRQIKERLLMKKIYFAAPLFNEMELKRNEEYTNLLEQWGYEVYLPQREAGLSAQILKDEKNDKLETNKRIFNTDLQGIKNSDILIFFLDGRVPDEGACVELGIAYALGKKCIGYKTDDRNLDFTGDDNLFIEGCMDFKVMHNIIELKNELEKN